MDATTPTRKLVFVGDPTTGKTSLLQSYRMGQYHNNEDQQLPVLDGFTMSVMVGEVEEVCLLWDTLGSIDFEKLRPLSYPKTDCFVICFAINDRSSFEHVTKLWIPEIMEHAPLVPFIIVCTKTDLREESPPPATLSTEEIRLMVDSTESLGYVECSSKKDVKDAEVILRSAVKAIHTHKEKLKEAKNSQSSCRIL